MKHIKKSIFTLLFSLVLSQSYAQTPVVSSETRIKKIEVAGSAEMNISPDEIFVNFTLQEYYNKQKTKIDIDEIQKEFLARCEKAGVLKDQIQIMNMSGFDQNPWYWRRKKKEQPDLMASTTYIIKFASAAEIDRVVNLLDDNATQNMYISKTSHSRMEDFRKEIKIKALQAAKVKAQYLCESIGEKVGQALFIQEVEASQPMPMMREMAYSNMAMDKVSANEGIDFQKINIRYEIRAQFEIK